MISLHKMKRSKLWYIFMILLACGMFGCADAPLSPVSGNPEILVHKNVAQVRDELISIMSARGYVPTEDSPNIVAFSRQLDNGSAVLYTLAIGNAYSSYPQQDVKFTMIPQGEDTHVYGFVRFSMQGAFGQAQNVELTRGKAGRELQEMLTSL